MDTGHLNQNPQESLSIQPKKSGQLNRGLLREDMRNGEASAVDQTLGVRSTTPPAENSNNYVYERTVEFPQPSIAGIGVVTDAGAKDTTRYFFSQIWTVSKTGTGTYSIVHNIGESKYNVILTPVATAAFSIQVSQFNNNDFEVKTFDAAGVATDCAFTFVVYIIP